MATASKIEWAEQLSSFGSAKSYYSGRIENGEGCSLKFWLSRLSDDISGMVKVCKITDVAKYAAGTIRYQTITKKTLPGRDS